MAQGCVWQLHPTAAGGFAVVTAAVGVVRQRKEAEAARRRAETTELLLCAKADELLPGGGQARNMSSGEDPPGTRPPPAQRCAHFAQRFHQLLGVVLLRCRHDLEVEVAHLGAALCRDDPQRVVAAVHAQHVCQRVDLGAVHVAAGRLYLLRIGLAACAGC